MGSRKLFSRAPLAAEYHRPSHSFMSTDLGTYASLLLSYGKSKALPDGMLTHDLIIRAGLEADLSLGSQLVQMYGKCGAMQESFTVFSGMPHCNVFAFNYIMGEYIRQEHNQQALQLFHQMLQEAIVPNRVTFVTLLSAYASHTSMRHGIEVHARVIRSEFHADVVIGTALVSMYGKCSSIDDAQKTFDSLLERNVVSWTALIAIYANHGCDKVALYLFQQMRLEGTLPDKVTFVNILAVFATVGVLEEGKRIHILILTSGLESDLMVANALINMYSQCGSLEDARKLLFRMPKRDVISWTALISVCMEHGYGTEALQLFEKMQEEGIVPDMVAFIAILSACGKNGTLVEGNWIHACLLNMGYASDLNVGAALVNMYGKCGSPEDAKRVFDMMSDRDVFLWNTMIAVYGQDGQLKEALQLLEQLQRDDKVLPDEVTFVSMLDACAGQAALSDGKQMHSLVQSCGFERNVIVCNAIINLYGKCGSLEDAQKTFDIMPCKNAISWTTIIAVYAQHGQGKVALHLFSRMRKEGPIPDEITFLSILVACKNAGLIAEGCQFFSFMTQLYRLSPGVDHFSCMVDLLGRAGRMDEAEDLFNKMPFQPTAETVTALLACGYQVHMRSEEGAAKHQFEIDSQSAAPFVAVSV